ncbi:BppU family phage baseplate upper protein [Bacillus cereus]|uniref:BppU family phage baseplate upper protein n=1 Tax=Bacillus cereus TaxID=1396 RepID=UPI00298403D9|nr:BppU family phage baseplate upper protein [Bacillus thuringiensis]
MTFKTYDINVDLVTDASTTCAIRFSQNDRNSAKLLLTITNKGAEIDLSQAKSVRMSFKKPDGTHVFQDDCQPINALKGKYQIVLKTQTLAAIGNVIAQIHIEEEDRMIDTQKFFFVVNESLSGNKAIESTNEFPVIQKAIEAGKKLAGVDIDGIIAAGELAKDAVKKSGDTMTGNLTIERNDTGKYVRWSNKNAQEYSLGTAVNGFFELYDAKGQLSPFTYNPTTKEFNINTATNVVKKSGDTMSGNLTLDGSTGERAIVYKVGAGASDLIAMRNVLSTNKFSLRDYRTGLDIWSWKDNVFNLNATNTNLLKKTGDTMTGDLVFERPNGANSLVSFGTGEVGKRNYIYGGKDVLGAYSDEAGQLIWRYTPSTKTFDLNATNTNLLKKTGDTMTGNLHIEAGASNDKRLAWLKDDKLLWGFTTNGDLNLGMYDWKNNKQVWKYDGASFEFRQPVKFSKDGRAVLTLTADASNWDSNVGSFADRRGNTVTVKMAIKRNPSSVNTLVTTLPADMRPLSGMVQFLPASDGTPVKVLIGSDGRVDVYAVNKEIYILMSYVVD